MVQGARVAVLRWAPGGKVEIVGDAKRHSTSELIERLAKRDSRQA